MSIVLMGLVGSVGYALRDFPGKLFKLINAKIVSRFVFTVHIYEYDELFDVFEKWLCVNYQQQYRDVQAYISQSAPTDGDKRAIKVPPIFLKQAPNMFIISHNGKKIVVTKKEQVLNHATSFSSMFAYEYIIRGYLAKNEILNLLDNIVKDAYSKLSANTIRVYTHTDYGTWEFSDNISVKPIDKIILPSSLKDGMLADVEKFCASKDRYINLGIPYKRTYCLHGPPGTGKTSISLSIACHLGRNVYSLNMNSIRNDSYLQRAFKEISPNSILIIEDVDCIFKKRESVDSEVSFSSLLNCMDGAFYKEGLITFMTTNHIELLDPALLRAGRTDVKYEIGYPEVEQISDYLSTFYNQAIDLGFYFTNESVPMSAIQEVCIANMDDPDAAIEAIYDLVTVNKKSLKHIA